MCVVHGAGPQISAEMEHCGLAVAFIGGGRVTSAAVHAARLGLRVEIGETEVVP